MLRFCRFIIVSDMEIDNDIEMPGCTLRIRHIYRLRIEILHRIEQ